ncbi:SCO6745 family protein [Nocardia alni]|uniref:SCO6745 family protein n=1 Tax=Nocardia alni TaxID=2815723 RepID=UPI001C22BEFB|nr:hypothetical protein [Nocardia alni]
MSGYASGRFVMVAFGLGEQFYLNAGLAPVNRAPYERLGITDAAQTYFATRSAPLGAVPAEVVLATFYNFHPDKIKRYIPSVFASATPAEVLEAQREVADETLRVYLGDWVDSSDAKEAAAIVRRAAEGRNIAGRPLYAGLSAMSWPDRGNTHLTLWHGFTLLREFRGDSHIAVLVANGIDGCECALLMTAAAIGGCECHSFFNDLGLVFDVDAPADPNVLADREWPAAEKRAALQRLVDRGLLQADGSVTPAGMALHIEMEKATDSASTSPIDRDEGSKADRLAELIAEPVVRMRGVFNLASVGEPGSVDV